MAGPQRIAIVGLGVNNQPLVPFFLGRGDHVIVADRKPKVNIEHTLTAMGWDPGAVQVLGSDDYLANLAGMAVDQVYVTPGMPKDLPELAQMAAAGAKITCETDLFFELCPAPIIGITGSAGKTTTTTLVGLGLKQDGRRRLHVGGNIGTSLLPEVAQISRDDWVVMELSSFQLELVTKSPHGAAILNLSPNHLDVHRDFAAYRAAKARIWDFQSKNDWALIPMDDSQLQTLFSGHQARPVRFSLTELPAVGTGIRNGWLVWQDENGPVPVIETDKIQIPGRHNIANALAALAIHVMAGGDPQAMAKALASFTGVPHRLEKVREHDNIIYINDSIATAPDRTMAALVAIKAPIVLIAGGYDKHLDYDGLGRAIGHSTVRAVIVLGQTAHKIADAVAAHSTIPVVYVEDFDAAVDAARRRAKPGDVVLLSPASASYDMFLNFEQRGQRFREIVQQW